MALPLYGNIPLPASAVANANAKGIGSNLSLSPTGAVLGGGASNYTPPVPTAAPAATAPTATAITTPQNSQIKTPAGQQFIDSQVPTTNPVGTTLSTTNQPVTTGTTTPAATSTNTASNSANTPYQDALNKYIASLDTGNNVSGQLATASLNARRQYDSALGASGGTVAGAQGEASAINRQNSPALADLGLAEQGASAASNTALARLNYEKGLLPSTSGFDLSPGAQHYAYNPATGKTELVASAPATPKTIGTPQTGIYTQNTDGSYTQTMAPVGGDNVQSLAQELVTGNLAPADLSKRSTGVGSYSDILKAANDLSIRQTGKPFDIAKAGTDYKFANNPQTQNTLNFLGSLVGSADGSAPGNLDQLVNLSKQVAEPRGLLGLGQSQFPALNDTIQWAKLSSGDPTVASYYATLLEVSDQVAKVLQGGGSGGTSDAKLAQAQSLFQKGFTKDQVAAVAGTLKPLLQNRAQSMVKDNPYLSSYAGQFGITQNNNKSSSTPASPSGSVNYNF